MERHGEFAVRGGIIDVFPVQSMQPVRLDFFGDDIDEIRPFSIGTQRSEGAFAEVAGYPARELLIDLKGRGLTVAPEIAVGDGALGLWKALMH